MSTKMYSMASVVVSVHVPELVTALSSLLDPLDKRPTTYNGTLHTYKKQL